jgi:hypothetical protein
VASLRVDFALSKTHWPQERFAEHPEPFFPVTTRCSRRMRISGQQFRRFQETFHRSGAQLAVPAGIPEPARFRQSLRRIRDAPPPESLPHPGVIGSNPLQGQGKDVCWSEA